MFVFPSDPQARPETKPSKIKAKGLYCAASRCSPTQSRLSPGIKRAGDDQSRLPRSEGQQTGQHTVVGEVVFDERAT